VIGLRRLIRNDIPVIGVYGANREGSGDMYNKGGNMMHTIRQIVNDDEKWRGILRGMNDTFRHQTVMGKQIEDYMSTQAGVSFGKVFDQYLRTTMVPTLEYRIVGDTLSYRWANVVPGFDMPIRVTLDWPTWTLIKPTEAWQTATVRLGNPTDFKVDENFYVVPKLVDGRP